MLEPDLLLLDLRIESILRLERMLVQLLIKVVVSLGHPGNRLRRSPEVQAHPIQLTLLGLLLHILPLAGSGILRLEAVTVPLLLLILFEKVVLRLLLDILPDYLEKTVVELVAKRQLFHAQLPGHSNFSSFFKLEHEALLLEVDELFEGVNVEWPFQQPQLD